ncbi:MAG: hypothetical protein ABR503_01665 [Chitinophagaceae bacterium]
MSKINMQMKLINHLILPSAVTVFLVITATACNNQTKVTENDAENSNRISSSANEKLFDKLVGTWQDGKTFERWSKNANGTYTSVAFSVKNNDTSWNEQAAVYQENNKWIFENTVKGQNDGKAVKFTSTLLNDTAVRFSNPAHDFPTDVHYTVADANTVNAFIIGPNNKGGKDSFFFNYKRLKQ